MSKFVVLPETFCDGLGAALCEAAGINGDMVRRVVLDLQVGSAAKIAFETYADDKILGADISGLGAKEYLEGLNGQMVDVT